MDLTSTVFPSFTTHRRKKKIKKRKKKPGDQKAVWSLSSHFRVDSKSWFFFYSWLFKPNKWIWRLDKRERGSHNSIWRGSKAHSGWGWKVNRLDPWTNYNHLFTTLRTPIRAHECSKILNQSKWIRSSAVSHCTSARQNRDWVQV